MSERITQAALDRLERNAAAQLHAAICAEDRLRDTQFAEVYRRLADLNNSHEKAIEEKRRTDAEALKVQERTVTRAEFQTWKDEVERRFNVQAGASTEALKVASGVAALTARQWAFATAIAMLIINLAIRYFTPSLGRP